MFGQEIVQKIYLVIKKFKIKIKMDDKVNFKRFFYMIYLQQLNIKNQKKQGKKYHIGHSQGEQYF